MGKPELQDSIIRTIRDLSAAQQLQLWEIIQSMNAKTTKSHPDNVLQFAGAIPKDQLEEMEAAIQQ